MKGFIKLFLIFVVCVFLAGCDSQEFWSQPSLFGLPLGVILFSFWILGVLNKNNTSNNSSPDRKRSTIKEYSPAKSDSADEKWRKWNEARGKPSISPNLVECKTCQKKVSKNAESCPHCGEPDFKKIKVQKMEPPPLRMIDTKIDPPESKAKNYFIHDISTNEVKGPFTANEMVTLEANNVIDEMTQVCEQGSSHWNNWGDV